jgi:hypothetical protein
MTEPLTFQWQNEYLCKTIYPMRTQKLIDFLVYYKEVDFWAQYKGKDIATLQAEVQEYTRAQELAAITAYKTYSSLRNYFMTADARGYFLKYKPIDETELAEINKLHQLFISSFPKDIRGERGFVQMQIANWTRRRDLTREWIKTRKRRLDAMALDHVKRPAETQELQAKETISLPMTEQELEQLRAFNDTYDKIEKPKLEWYRLQKSDPNFKTLEADFLVHYSPSKKITVQDIALWKAEQYEASLKNKNQFELLEEIYQRFKKEPTRYPYWLQYMIVHFSGMRYASAHGSWADPKDLLIQLRLAEVEKENKLIPNDLEVERLCKEKIAQYESAAAPNRPKLALSTEKIWKDKVALHMLSVKANGPKTRRAGLSALRAEEVRYDFMSMTNEEALKKLESMKAAFPKWAWKQIVKLTQLRVNHVADLNWETLTPEEEAERNSLQAADLRNIMNAWINKHIGSWREEHGRTHELIVSRAVCNETAEHIQHIRGHLPPGGLTPKPSWYRTNEKEKKVPGAFYVKPAAAADYVQGASILWLRFVNQVPNDWQVAHAVETEKGDGLIPKGFIGRKPKSKTDIPWQYKPGDTVTRSRTYMNASKVRVTEQQWLRWIHEATVVEVAETAEGQVILTYETALPDDDRGTSSIGLFKKSLAWLLSEGTEDAYNRSFIGYVPEGQVPVEHLKTMLDWNKILRKQVA